MPETQSAHVFTSPATANRSAPTSLVRHHLRPSAWPAIAGIAYVIAWATGLSVFPVNLSLAATAHQVVSAYAAHPGLGALQYGLNEGAAGVLLGVVLLVYITTARALGGRVPRLAVLAAVVAVAISLAQCVIGLTMIVQAQAGRLGETLALENTVDRMDGVKMLAIAVCACYVAIRRQGGRRLPAWLRVVSFALAVSIAVSAIAYLFLIEPLAWVVYVAGPFLLLWVAGVGIWLTLIRRR